ncbi:tetratricopeptide repeat protein [Uliginosibacterium gangwonense]|uniref:tetratricopeptide repeat protein n=1 Tax=Uliginosibacterium gangwonense TaxID=392736 RepID=UPI00037868DE|nr:tetratricopeptide repeat protein [Uliginosibacterium gangwonense]
MNPSLLQAAIQAEAAGDLGSAVAHYSALLAADPACVEALNNLGALAFRVGNKEDALSFYRQALAVRPDFLPARINLARALASLEQIDEAGSHYVEANRLGAELEGEYAQMLVSKGQPAAGQAIAQEACIAQPGKAELWLTLGNARLFQQSPEEAELCYRKAQSLANTPRARSNLALALLAQSRFAEAWPLYESRYDPALSATDAVRFQAPPCPQWQGESLTGQRILVMGEQGFGDQIHFARFIQYLAKQGVEVDLLCKPVLAGLLASAPGVHACMGALPVVPTYDFWTPLLSLPLHLGCMDGRACGQAPYLSADTGKREHWRNLLGGWATSSQRKIGLVWSGATGNSVDALRSIRLDDVLTLVQGLGERHRFFSLQVGEQAKDVLDQQRQAGIIPLGNKLHDFTDTAALVAELDLVIAVDTALAHLAGALGKPTWLLLPGTDWRWGRAGSATCTLYPGVRPFWRDPVLGWAPALQQLRHALEAG